MSKTAVIHVVDSLSLGGAERMAVELVNGLDPDRFDCTICATRSGGPLAEAVAPHVRYACLGRTGRWDRRGPKALADLVRRTSARIVHTHGRGSMRLVAFCRIARRFRVRHLFHDHYGDVEYERHASLELKICARLGFDAYIGVDRRLCDWAERRLGLPADRVWLVRNGVVAERFAGVDPMDVRREFGLPPDALVMVMVGNLRPQKDHPTALRAMALSRHRDRLRLLLVGGRPDSQTDYVAACDALTRELGLQGHAISVGERADVPRLLAGCDIGILSSRSESGPLALLEYLAAGLPYAVTETGEITRAVLGSGAGLVAPIGDAAGLARAIDRLASLTATQRKAMGELGRGLVAREFDQRGAIHQVMDLYDRLYPRQSGALK